MGDRWREAVAEHRDIAPAIVERAVKEGAIVCEASPGSSVEGVLTRVLNKTLDALGSQRIMPRGAEPAIDWRFDLLNADCDLERLCEGLRRHGEGRSCLYGPPGTGKTAFGRQLAKLLDRPLLVKRASDILSPYVGMAERNIAGMPGAIVDDLEQIVACHRIDVARAPVVENHRMNRCWLAGSLGDALHGAVRGRLQPALAAASALLSSSKERLSARNRTSAVRFAMAAGRHGGELNFAGPTTPIDNEQRIRHDCRPLVYRIDLHRSTDETASVHISKRFGSKRRTFRGGEHEPTSGGYWSH